MPKRHRDEYRPARSKKKVVEVVVGEEKEDEIPARTRSTRSGRTTSKGNFYVEITPDNRASCIICHDRLKKGIIRVGTLGMVLVNERWNKEMVSWCHILCYPADKRPPITDLFGHEKLSEAQVQEITTAWAGDEKEDGT
jgi:hypothetical protein